MTNTLWILYNIVMLNLLQNPFIGVYELRKNLPEILNAIKKNEANPAVITHQGKPQAVVMAVEYYLELMETLRDSAEPGYIEKLRKSKEEILKGKGIPAEKVFEELGL